MRKDRKSGRCITIHYRTNEFHHFSHQSRIQNATNNTEYLFREACRIFAEGWSDRKPLRQLGVQVTRLTGEMYQQFDLFSGLTPQQYERRVKLDETVDSLRNKYGEAVIRRARFTSMAKSSVMGEKGKKRRTM